MRILFLVTRADAVGGASIHTRDMAARLTRAGHDVLIGVGGRGPVTDGYERVGAKYVSLKYFRREISAVDGLACWEVVQLIRRFQPDLVSAHTSKAGFIGRLAAAVCRVPVIYTPHCWSFVDGFPKAKLYLWAERFAAPFATAIVAVSEDERQQGIASAVGHPHQITTVHNGMPETAAALRANPARTPVRLLMTGRHEQQKDQDTLIRALAQLKTIEWTLDLVGEGPRQPVVEALVKSLGLSDRVRFLGYRTDIPELLAAAQVFLLITHWEGFPRSILEAMRAGLPVVATDVGGIREAVDEGSTGFLVPRQDETRLAQRLAALIEDPATRARFGAAGRERYEQAFTFERMHGRYLELYRSLLPPARVV